MDTYRSSFCEFVSTPNTAFLVFWLRNQLRLWAHTPSHLILKCFGPTVRQKKNVDWLLSELTLNGVEVYIIQRWVKELRKRKFWQTDCNAFSFLSVSSYIFLAEREWQKEPTFSGQVSQGSLHNLALLKAIFPKPIFFLFSGQGYE